MEDFQAQIVGMANVPVGKTRGKWDFIDAYIKKLEAGQALRLVLPKGSSANGVIAHWKKIAQGRAKSVQTRQSDGSIKVWLFIANSGGG